MEALLDPEEIIAKVRRLAEIPASARGLEVSDVHYKPGGQVLRVVLDRVNGSVDINDCQAVSEHLSAELDALDLIPHAYRLEVSSPGLDRPLRREEDYRRFRGEAAKIILQQPIAGNSVLRGRLADCRNGMLRLEVEGGEPLWLPLSQVRSARLDPEPLVPQARRREKRKKR